MSVTIIRSFSTTVARARSSSTMVNILFYFCYPRINLKLTKNSFSLKNIQDLSNCFFHVSLVDHRNMKKYLKSLWFTYLEKKNDYLWKRLYIFRNILAVLKRFKCLIFHRKFKFIQLHYWKYWRRIQLHFWVEHFVVPKNLFFLQSFLTLHHHLQNLF